MLATIVWNVDPIMFHIGSWGLHYYSFGFLFAFLFGYLILNKAYKSEGVNTDLLDSVVIYVFLGTLIGARLGHCLFYQPDYFLTSTHWMEIFLPFDADGHFTGYEGLASHGAAIAIPIALVLYCRKYKANIWWVLDRLVIVVALGGGFIRLGNLFNSEIYGRPTDLPWGIMFPRGDSYRDQFCHPTQLYEALTYFTIFAVTYAVYLKKKGNLHSGRLFGWWLIALFGMRLLIEFVKNPQVAFEQGMPLVMGQILSIPFILCGIALVIISYKGILPNGPLTGEPTKKK